MSVVEKEGGVHADRFAYFDAAREFTPYLATVARDMLFVVKTSDAGLGRALFATRHRPEFRLLRRAVAAIEGLIGPEAVGGKLFVDVGANIGTATIPAVRLHGFGSALAIEPEPENVRVLRANLLLNQVSDRTEVLAAAASNEVGGAALVVEPERGAKHWITATPERVTQKPGKPRRETITVETVTLDHLVGLGVIEPEQTGLLWVDAEGHEAFVLSGASTLLDRGTPLIMEWHPRYLETRGDVGRIMDAVSANYTHYVSMRRPFALRPVESLRELPTGDSTDAPTKLDILVLKLSRESARGVEDLLDLIEPPESRFAPGRLLRRARALLRRRPSVSSRQ